MTETIVARDGRGYAPRPRVTRCQQCGAVHLGDCYQPTAACRAAHHVSTLESATGRRTCNYCRNGATATRHVPGDGWHYVLGWTDPEPYSFSLSPVHDSTSCVLATARRLCELAGLSLAEAWRAAYPDEEWGAPEEAADLDAALAFVDWPELPWPELRRRVLDDLTDCNYHGLCAELDDRLPEGTPR